MKNPPRRSQRVALWAMAVLVCAAAPVWAARAHHTELRHKAPYYTGKAKSVTEPIALAGLRAGPAFDAVGKMSPVAAELLPEIRAYLESLELVALEAPSAPDLYVGVPEGFYWPEEAEAEIEGWHRKRESVLVRVVDPSGGDKKKLAEAARAAGATHYLFVQLDLSDYPVLQTNWKGSKAIDLGTGHRVALPWLTSLDYPVEVLHFTAALYRADGKFVRGGAEAFVAQRNPFRDSVAGLQRATTAEALRTALDVRRSDLPGEPVAWQVALRNLVGQLTGRTTLVAEAGE